MATNYDDLYRDTPNALGEANPHVLAFFESQEPALTVLDIGCGQGRDALAIARLGHAVHGIDLSSNGVSQMLADAGASDLPITGEVTDIRAYEPQAIYDVLLIDRTLHMLTDEAERLSIFARLLNALEIGGTLLLLDEPSNMAGFRATMDAHTTHWETRFVGQPRIKGRPDTGVLFAHAVR